MSLAERVLAQINAQFPEEARVRTWNFVDALNECGAFADSLAFATRVDSEDRGELTSAIFEAWAAVSPEQAVRTALALSTKRERDHALQAVVATWAAGRPEAAVAFAAGVADGAKRSIAPRSFSVTRVTRSSPVPSTPNVGRVLPSSSSRRCTVASPSAEPSSAMDSVEKAEP